MNKFCIKENYVCNLNPVQPQYSVEESLIYQAAVYQFAASMIPARGNYSVLDIGCGLGVKLKKYIHRSGIRITGVDDPLNIQLCSETHDFGQWVTDDIENSTAQFSDSFDLLMAVDVIEHLINPNFLLTYIADHAAPNSQILLSTPERDLRRGVDETGPPDNGAHVREWNQIEFAEYLTSAGFIILEHKIVEMCPGMKTCQVVRCEIDYYQHETS